MRNLESASYSNALITNKIMIENQMIEITKMTEIHKEEMIIIIDKL